MSVKYTVPVEESVSLDVFCLVLVFFGEIDTVA